MNKINICCQDNIQTVLSNFIDEDFKSGKDGRITSCTHCNTVFSLYCENNKLIIHKNLA